MPTHQLDIGIVDLSGIPDSRLFHDYTPPATADNLTPYTHPQEYRRVLVEANTYPWNYCPIAVHQILVCRLQVRP